MIQFNNVHELSVAHAAGEIQTPTFVSIRGYRNSEGEVSNYLLNLGTNYHNAQMADLMMLQFVPVEGWNFPEDIPQAVCARAHQELLEAATRNISEDYEEHTSASRTQLDMYDTVMPNIKIHIHNETLYLFGMLIRKTVVEAVEYPVRNKRVLTRAKDVIRRNYATGKYRQFFLSKIHNIKVNGQELIFELQDDDGAQ